MWLTFFLLLYTIFLSLVCILGLYMSYNVIVHKVPLIPTEARISDAMIKTANLSTGQTVYDLGCGFGSILFYAAKHHPKNNYIGYDIVRPAIWLARLKAAVFKAPIKFYCQDFFKKDFTSADVIFTYLWPSIMDRIYVEIWPQLKPGTKLISHGFPITNLEPAQVIKSKQNKIFVYVKD